MHDYLNSLREHKASAEPSEAWTLFDLDSPGDTDDRVTTGNDAGKLVGRLRADFFGPKVSFVPAKLVWQPKPEGILGSTADSHEIFAVGRDLWCQGKGMDHQIHTCTSAPDARLPVFVETLKAHAIETVDDIAAILRGHKPEGPRASIAIGAARSALIAGNWQAALVTATDCFAAHSRQLNAGNWPHKSWQQAHILALGFYIAAALNILSNDLDSGDMINIKTCFGMSDAKLHGNKRAARPASFSLSHLHPYVIRLGRIALEALSMATLLTHKKEIPSWLGVCIVLAEETCVSAMIPRCISDQRFGSDTLPQKAQTGPCSNNCCGSFIVPNTLPPGSPQIAPTRAIPRVPDPRLSVADFYSHFVNTNSPVIITGHMTLARGWSPTEFWRDLSVLLKDKSTEHRLVPVEVGRFQEGQGAGVITLGDLVRNYLVSSNLCHSTAGIAPLTHYNLLGAEDESSRGNSRMSIAYMSQHPIFHQIPAFQHMFCIPPFTLGRLHPNVGAINAWLGTKDTTTTLHRDPYNNILAQTAGFKYIRLYSTSQTKFLYAEPAVRGTNDNTFMRSPVCVENPDLTQFPLFSSALYYETILGPGDMLFIPYGMWHYVRSLTTSFSINFWWK